MSILIKGMEMPKNCDRCFFCHYIHADEDHEHFYVCSLENWNKPITHLPINPIQAKSKPDWCPLVPVPPHGDLIDRNKLYEKTAEWESQALHMVELTMNDEDTTEWKRWSTVLTERSAFKVDVADAPTIIEAEVDDEMC